MDPGQPAPVGWALSRKQGPGAVSPTVLMRQKLSGTLRVNGLAFVMFLGAGQPGGWPFRLVWCW